jgi:proteasome lid subunit RPN8/RPN11
MASRADPLRLSWLGWWRLVRQLRRRGRGLRESGAFLLGHRRAATGIVTDFVFYDEIDSGALSRGHVHLSGEALGKVWDRCAAAGLEVLADVHTHPGVSGQSDSDRAYPMIAIKGHTALIIPDFARSAINLRGVGVYRHLGASNWISLPSPKAAWRGIIF